MKETILAKLSELLSDILDQELILTETTVTKDVEGWDSLVQMTFMLLIEKEFQIELTIEEISAFENVGALVERILAKEDTNA